MKRSIAFVFVFFSVFSTCSYGNLTGKTWMNMPKQAKFALIRGYHEGVTYGAMEAAHEAARIYSPTKKGDIKKIVEGDKGSDNWENFKRITQKAEETHALHHDLKDVVEQMNYLYKEPATRIIPWRLMYNLAQDRLDGEDVSEEVSGLIKDKPWKANLLNLDLNN